MVQFFKNYMTKNGCLIDHRLQRAFLKACGSLRSESAPTLIYSKMNHVANQLVLKIISVQKFS